MSTISLLHAYFEFEFPINKFFCSNPWFTLSNQSFDLVFMVWKVNHTFQQEGLFC